MRASVEARRVLLPRRANPAVPPRLPPPENDRVAALHQAVLQGGAVGAGAGALFAHYAAADAVAIAFGAALGTATGFVCGLLIWVSAVEFPEAPIPPVRGPTRARSTRR